MSLIDRLVKTEGFDVIPYHSFTSVLYEYKNGHIDGASAISKLGLSGSEITDAQALLSKILSGDITFQDVSEVLSMAENGHYTKAEVLARLGF